MWFGFTYPFVAGVVIGEVDIPHIYDMGHIPYSHFCEYPGPTT
jgi:hypothetical protein